MNKSKRIYYENLLKDKRRRLELYKAREEELLTGEAQSYSLGSRSKSKFNISLTELQNAIKKLEEEIAELENLLYGNSGSRKVISIIPSF